MAATILVACPAVAHIEGSEHEEQIQGLVPAILLDLETVDAEGNSANQVYSMDADDLTMLEGVIARTREKLDAIKLKYGDELLADQ